MQIHDPLNWWERRDSLLLSTNGMASAGSGKTVCEGDQGRPCCFAAFAKQSKVPSGLG